MWQWLRRVIQRPGTVDLAPYRRVVSAAAKLEDEVRALTDSELTAMAGKLAQKDFKDFNRDELAELCALGREAADRALGERMFDVQLVGSLAMLAGRVVEMATGEGKTLAATLAASGFALRGHQVHVLTVNDYLARRDAEWMGPVYELLGVSVGWVSQDSTPDERRAAYAAQVTYAAVSEVGFDHLRDGLVTDEDELVLPEPAVAIVDEADSVLVDEARVPLVLAGALSVAKPAAESSDSSDSADPEAEVVVDPALVRIMKVLRAGVHYETDADRRNVHLTEVGSHVVESALGGINLYDAEHLGKLAEVNVALHAHALLRKDVDYIVRDGRVQLVSESRGRIAQLQRWPDGLQAAVEAKESVSRSESGEVLDSLTMQALIGRYPTVCGMTGTALVVGEQLREFYKLEVAVVPPNVPCVRVDEPDLLYATIKAKETALVTKVVEAHEAGRPVLVGTLDVGESERLAERLAKAGVSCSVLNARNDAEEAAIVAEAGAHGTVTVSTQMAGRGTDIRLGGRRGEDGRDRVVELGGLYVIGSGRYYSSRLDNQLRGRAGRQGDPGESVFFTSLQDELFVDYGEEELRSGRRETDKPLTDRGSQSAMEHAQRVAEGVELEVHRNTWRYTRLIEHQRTLLGAQRDKLLRTDLAAEQIEKDQSERWTELAETVDVEVLGRVARQISLHHLNRCWAEHLAFLADLREGIHLRALGRENPLDEFHRAAIPAFAELLVTAREQAAETFATAEITPDGFDLDAAGLVRPTSTWTYLVQDNPFGSDSDRVMRSISGVLMNRKRRRRSD